jgi:hypothetical protein
VTAPWQKLPGPTVKEPVFDPEAYALGRELASLIGLGLATDPRSLQARIGSSEIGWLCDRRVAYKLHNYPSTNTEVRADPLRRAIGTGMHKVLADVFYRLDQGSGRFLIEQPVTYQGIPGTADLVHRVAETVIDWKTATKAKIAQVRRDGVPRHYQVQVQLYAAGLIERGEQIKNVAVVYLPIDGDKNDGLNLIHVWRAPVDRSVADDAVQRYERIAQAKPAQTPARPDRMCPWCSHYLPGSTSLEDGCPGNTEEATK